MRGGDVYDRLSRSRYLSHTARDHLGRAFVLFVRLTPTSAAVRVRYEPDASVKTWRCDLCGNWSVHCAYTHGWQPRCGASDHERRIPIAEGVLLTDSAITTASRRRNRTMGQAAQWPPRLTRPRATAATAVPTGTCGQPEASRGSGFKLITTDEAARMIGCSPRKVRRIATGLGGTFTGGRWLVDRHRRPLVRVSTAPHGAMRRLPTRREPVALVRVAAHVLVKRRERRASDRRVQR